MQRPEETVGFGIVTVHTQRGGRGDAERMSRELRSDIQELQIRVCQSFQGFQRGDVPREKQDLSHQTYV